MEIQDTKKRKSKEILDDEKTVHALGVEELILLLYPELLSL